MEETGNPFRRLAIATLVWDDWNLEHILKHRVTRNEIEELVFESEWIAVPTYKERTKVIGRLSNGRILTVVLGQTPGVPASYYVFSARSGARAEVRLLERAEGGLR